MTQISAAENLVIQADATEWRLLSYSPIGAETEVLRAAPGEPLIFDAGFALTRRLPAAGKLPTKYIQMVVLGWSHDDDAWHLGLLLVDEIAQIRGSRWCEVANWPDPDSEVFQPLAQQSGQALAGVIGVPFRIVPPRTQAEVIARRAVPLPQPPLDIGTWSVKKQGEDLLFTRSARWRNGRIIRFVWYALLTAIYIALSVSTLQSNLALPNSGIMLPSPEMLPYLGLGASVVSLLIALYALYELLGKVNRIRVEAERVVALRGERERWQIPLDAIKGVYVTHVLRQRRRLLVYYGEINIYTQSGAFVRLVQQAEKDNEEVPNSETLRINEGVTPLTPNEHLTELQTAALHIAGRLGGVPCWYDQRER